GNRRLGAVPGEWFEARSPASCQDDRQHVAIHQTTSTRCPDDRRVLNSTGSRKKSYYPICRGSTCKPLGSGIAPSLKEPRGLGRRWPCSSLRAIPRPSPRERGDRHGNNREP